MTKDIDKVDEEVAYDESKIIGSREAAMELHRRLVILDVLNLAKEYVGSLSLLRVAPDDNAAAICARVIRAQIAEKFPSSPGIRAYTKQIKVKLTEEQSAALKLNTKLSNNMSRLRYLPAVQSAFNGLAAARSRLSSIVRASSDYQTLSIHMNFENAELASVGVRSYVLGLLAAIDTYKRALDGIIVPIALITPLEDAIEKSLSTGVVREGAANRMLVANLYTSLVGAASPLDNLPTEELVWPPADASLSDLNWVTNQDTVATPAALGTAASATSVLVSSEDDSLAAMADEDAGEPFPDIPTAPTIRPVPVSVQERLNQILRDRGEM